MYASRNPFCFNGLALPMDNLGSSRLNQNFTFANFVSGRANKFARGVGLQAAEHPGMPNNNPLVIVGREGLGKTHLLHAIGNQMRKANPVARIKYAHSLSFVDAVFFAYRNMKFDAFRQRFHSLDLLLLDDIQCLNGKSHSQEELLRVFNALIGNRKQIVVTSRCLIGEMENMNPQLAGCLKSGLNVKLEQPDVEFRRAILHAKAAEENILLDDVVAIYLAHIDLSTVREIEVILQRIVAGSRYLDVPISLKLAKETLKGIYEL